MFTRLKSIAIILYLIVLLITLFVECEKEKQNVKETELIYNNGMGYGHQGVTKGPGKSWFVFCTKHLFRYESDDFSIDQTNLIRNESPFSHSDFSNTGLSHIGAPEYYNGKVYTFAKTPNDEPIDKIKMRLVWYNADDLSYETSSYRIIKNIPKTSNGYIQIVSGGPHIVEPYFYCAIARRYKDIKPENMPVDVIGKFSLSTGEFIEFIQLSESYYRPQGIDMDGKGNFYIACQDHGIKMYNSKGEYQKIVFKCEREKDIHEGFYYDAVNHNLTLAVTKYSPPKKHLIFQVNW